MSHFNTEQVIKKVLKQQPTIKDKKSLPPEVKKTLEIWVVWRAFFKRRY